MLKEGCVDLMWGCVFSTKLWGTSFGDIGYFVMLHICFCFNLLFYYHYLLKKFR